MPEPHAPQPVEVAFVRPGSGSRSAIQEWRSRATGRVHEVPEAQSYAPADVLGEGSTGWLIYAGGTPWVGETEEEARRMARRAAGRPPPRRSAPRPRGGRGAKTPWGWIFAAVLMAVIVWAMVR